MIVKMLTLGELEVNCYVVADETTREAIIIDPGADPQTIKRCLAQNKLKPLLIVNTHGHADHIGANRFFELPIYIHEQDESFLQDPHKNLSAAFGLTVTSPPAAKLMHEGDQIPIGSHRLRVVHTPGHTPGSISLELDTMVFTGDTLFCEGVGRTDFPYGSEKSLFESITTKILTMPGDTVIYPGHGPASTIKHEKHSNPFL